MSDWIGPLALLESVEQLRHLPTLVLELVGGFALGGLVTGLVARLIVAGVTRQKIPRWILNVIRCLGGLAVALVLFQILGGGGGGGPGGPGGPGEGTGDGSGDKVSTTAPPSQEKPREKSPMKEPPPEAARPLEIEVLSNEAVERIAGKEAVNAGRYYRVHEPGSTRLLSLAEVKKRIDPEGEPKYRYLMLVLYLEDGPDREVPRVLDLRKWAESLQVKDALGHVKVDVVTRAGKTPPG